jgi:small subunit ribosomal protein S17
VSEATETTEANAPAAAAPPAAPAEPQAVVTPKERKAARKASKAAPARAATTVEQRITERAEKRRKAAVARRVQRARARSAHKSAAAPVPPTPPAVEHEGRQKLRQGIVVSDKANKTITVRIDVARRHPRYEKIVRSSTTLHAHDESNEAGAGDTVTIVECRPLSRLKRWRLVEVLEKAR